MAVDNLLSADIVTADGKFLTASATENQDLFWGLRGGGGNFGVVTSFEYRLHPVGPTVLGGMLIYPYEQAKEVLKLFRDLTSAASDELAADAALMSSPDGDPVAVIAICYNGPIEEGERAIKPLREFGAPLMGQIGPIPYTAVQRMIDDPYPPGLQNYWKSNFMRELSDEAIDTVVAHCANRPSPMCHGLIEFQLGGAISRVGEEETAFNHRDVAYAFVSLGVTPDPDRCARWAREFWEAMRPFTTDGVYVNYLGQEGDEGVERVKAAYGPQKYERLVSLKKKYDPANVFRLNQNIKP